MEVFIMDRDCRSVSNSSFSGCPLGAENVPTISTTLSPSDLLGSWRVRWGIERMDYAVSPGLYAIGEPDATSPVLVSANYKLTFDTLRQNLTGLDCWLLILDTDGINVWCAAGKGTFGTDELLRRIEAVKLSEVVTHRELVLPQLGAPGIDAHEVTKRSGFTVRYGPVRAKDIKAYIAAGYQATREMRLVEFTLTDRAALVPMELLPAIETSLPVLGAAFAVDLLARGIYSKKLFSIADLVACAGAVISGTTITTLLLPYIPGKAFSLKGWLVGAAWSIIYLVKSGVLCAGNYLLSAGYLLCLPAVSSFFALNLTGSSTYTSPSGVKKEMQVSLPLIAASALIGIMLVIISRATDGRENR